MVIKLFVGPHIILQTCSGEQSMASVGCAGNVTPPPMAVSQLLVLLAAALVVGRHVPTKRLASVRNPAAWQKPQVCDDRRIKNHDVLKNVHLEVSNTRGF